MGSGAGALAEIVGLGHYVAADHAAGFADVELIGPAAVVGEFVLGEAVAVHAVAHDLRHAGVVRQEIEIALLVVAVGGNDLLARGVVGVGVVFAEADVVGRDHREIAVGVDVVLVRAVRRGQRDELQELGDRRGIGGLDGALQQFVLGRVVAGRRGPGLSVGVRGDGEAEVVGLDFVVGGAGRGGEIGAEAG